MQRSAFLIFAGLIAGAASAQTLNGFNVSEASVPPSEILKGGPPRDGIPAIDDPRFLTARQARFLKGDDRVLGVVVQGVAKAYPIRILDWHELVNDEAGGQPFVVTYCPLCGTGMVFDSRVDGRALDFGVSGLLYNSDVLLYDRQSESLWSQVMAEAVTGPKKGTRLTEIPVRHTSWTDWRERHPKTQVLSTDTGHNRDYSRSPYQGYTQSRSTYFKVRHKAPPTYHPKEQVLGLRRDGDAKAYPYIELRKAGKESFEDTLAGEPVTIHWDSRAETAWATGPDGKEIPTIIGFWFAWFTFHPETQIWKAGG